MTLVPASSHSPVVSAVKTLTAAQIGALGSTPVEVIPAIAGKAIMPVGGAFEYIPGAVGFGGDGDLELKAGGAPILYFGTGAGLSGLTAKIENAQTGRGISVRGTALSIDSDSTIGIAGVIATSSLLAGGNDYVAGDTATIGGGTSGLITVSTVAKQFPIVSLVQGAKTFTVTGNASAVITALTGLKVIRSTGNDASYTVVSSVFGAGQTVITVSEVIASAVADGKAEPDDGTGGAILTYALTNPGTGYTVATHTLDAVSPSVGVNASISVLTISSPSDGTARVTVYYAVV